MCGLCFLVLDDIDVVLEDIVTDIRYPYITDRFWKKRKNGRLIAGIPPVRYY